MVQYFVPDFTVFLSIALKIWKLFFKGGPRERGVPLTLVDLIYMEELLVKTNFKKKNSPSQGNK